MENNREYRVHTMYTKVGSSTFRNSRSIFWRETFTTGRYVLFACTFDPALEGEFHLRCFAGHNIHMKYVVTLCSAHILYVQLHKAGDHFGQYDTNILAVMGR